MMECSVCSVLFDSNKSENIFRCGDTYVCSKICSNRRYTTIKKVDPELNLPHKWDSFNNISNKNDSEYPPIYKHYIQDNELPHHLKNNESDESYESDESDESDEPIYISDIYHNLSYKRKSVVASFGMFFLAGLVINII